MSRLWKLNIILLILIVILVWVAVITFPDPKLKIVACDVGQGDAILITYGSSQVLVDGGPNNRVLGCLSEHMPFWDRGIELVILTHPQKDHYQGLIEVFDRYDVKHLLANPINSSSSDYQVLKSNVGGSGTKVSNPTTGMVIRLGMIRLDILHPTEKYIIDNSTAASDQSQGVSTQTGVLGSFTTNKDPNGFSIVVLLDFNDFEALFTGDIDPEISDQLAEMLRDYPLVSDGNIEYLKVPHHGSKNGLSKDLLESVNPSVSVISNAENNSYGHPHKEILDMLSGSETMILRTDELGSVIIKTDGQKVYVK